MPQMPVLGLGSEENDRTWIVPSNNVDIVFHKNDLWLVLEERNGVQFVVTSDFS